MGENSLAHDASCAAPHMELLCMGCEQAKQERLIAENQRLVEGIDALCGLILGARCHGADKDEMLDLIYALSPTNPEPSP